MPYKRIISLVPSLTELIVDLGLTDQIVGRTRFCIHPEDSINSIQIIGGTKNPNIEKIRDLKPDLVIANKEENRREDIELIENFSEVLITDISTIDGAFDSILLIGKKLNKQSRSLELVNQIKDHLPDSKYEPIRTLYFIWKDPWVSVGKDTYIHDVMNRFGLSNVMGYRNRYPEIHLEELIELNPELILLSSEPYPFKEKHINELQTHLPNSSIQLIDGEWFSWYGSRMLPSFKNLKTWRNQLLI